MHWNKITYDKHSCAMHWDCMAYDKHSCAMHFDCIAYDMHSIGIAVRNTFNLRGKVDTSLIFSLRS